MSKICISKSVNDARIPVRASYINLYKWPESDSEFMKSAAAHGARRRHTAVVDSVSCRQMYLRSYTFSRKESVPERTVKCFGRVRETAEALVRRRRRPIRRCVVVRRVKEFSCAAVAAIFRRLLFCTTTVDVAECVLVVFFITNIRLLFSLFDSLLLFVI